jgi:lysozyme
MIYSVNTFYNKYCAPKFNNYYLMIGRYGNDKPFIKGKGTYTIWQKSQIGRIAGISKNVDIDIFHKKASVKVILLNDSGNI